MEPEQVLTRQVAAADWKDDVQRHAVSERVPSHPWAVLADCRQAVAQAGRASYWDWALAEV